MYSSCDFVFRRFRPGNKRIATPKTIAAPNNRFPLIVNDVPPP